MILVIILVLGIFSFLVIAHEFGHFILARRNGVQVDEFGIGFPPKLYGVKRGKTLYSINLLPIGGFVRLKGEQGEVGGKDSFGSQRTWVKTKILLAGVTVNFVIAYVIIAGLLVTGMPPITPGKLPSFGQRPSSVSDSKLLVVGVEPGSLAQKNAILQGGYIVSVNSQSVSSPDQLKSIIQANAGKSVKIAVVYHSSKRTVAVNLPAANGTKGLLGVATVTENLQRYSWWAVPIVSLVVCLQMILATLGAFGGLIVGLFTRAQVSQAVTGPIGITVLFGEILKYGPTYVFGLVASISLSLAIINGLPLPALDGGRLLVIVLQRMGIKITDRTEALVHATGFVLLIGLMIIVSVTDIMRLSQ